MWVSDVVLENNAGQGGGAIHAMTSQPVLQARLVSLDRCLSGLDDCGWLGLAGPVGLSGMALLDDAPSRRHPKMFWSGVDCFRAFLFPQCARKGRMDRRLYLMKQTKTGEHPSTLGLRTEW